MLGWRRQQPLTTMPCSAESTCSRSLPSCCPSQTVQGHLKHIFLVGGCDGSGESRGQHCIARRGTLCPSAANYGGADTRHCLLLTCLIRLLPSGLIRLLLHMPLSSSPAAPEPERRYFGQVAKATPADTMLLTLGCGKFR